MRILFLLSLIVVSCRGSPNGAPATQAVCDQMTPNHGVAAQESASPFRLEVSSTSVKSGEILSVQIISDEGRSFKGFYLKALTNDPENPEVVGEFEADEDESTPFNFRDCSEKTRNAVTHASRDLKSKINFKWKSPISFGGSVHFK